MDKQRIMTPAISIIHPSRSRPAMAMATFTEWVSKAQNRNLFEYILSIDHSDPMKKSYESIPCDQILISDNTTAIQAINKAAKRAKGNIILVVSDDFSCPENWDYEILKATNGKTDWLLRVNDTLQKYLITLPIMDRAYYDRFGYVYHPGFSHLFCDTEMTCVADMLDKIIDAPHLTFKHNHHSQTKLTDDISRKNDATWKQGEALFIEHAKANFGLTEFRKITDQKMIHWLKTHGVNP